MVPALMTIVLYAGIIISASMPGMILFVPLTAILKIINDREGRLKPFNILLNRNEGNGVNDKSESHMPEQPPDLTFFSGLRKSEIPSLLKEFGKNVLGPDKQHGFLHAIWAIIKEPMFLMLVFASALYFVLGQTDEGMLMLIAMCFVVAISIYQETKSSRALKALKEFTQARIAVIRDQREEMILTEELLPGDVMILSEGDKVPADAVILHANDLTVNESVITGESFPVEKNEHFGSNQLFQGTLIDSGSCYARVSLTGIHTVLGKIGKSLNDHTTSKTALQKQISHFVKWLTAFGLAAFVAIWLINFIHSRDVLQSLLLGLTLAMSAVPEEIPVAFSTFMALGSVNMAKLGIITREAKTIENLGAVNVICLDKTGTITKNKMEVKEVYHYETGQVKGPDDGAETGINHVLLFARMACEKEPFDSMEKAIRDAYQKYDQTEYFKKMHVVHEYLLGGIPPMMTHVYETDKGIWVAGKGAPERILKICKLDSDTLNKQEKIVSVMASSGFRVLGVCSAIHLVSAFPEKQDDFNWKFEGFLSLYDPPKENVRETFEKWYQAGISIKLITGDYPATALNIAAITGLRYGQDYLTGEQIMNLPEEILRKCVVDINMYVRMFPEAKLKVVNALKANQQIIAMTGDGVNDALALKSADIGVAMGSKGTEVAKEASDLVITDDDLDKITDSIAEGRKIYANFKKAVRYIISIHIPIILTASLPLVFGWKYPNVFMPVHIIFMELIMGPTCSVFFEKEPVESGIMKSKPRPFRQNIFSGKELQMSILQGMLISAGLLTLYFYFMQHGYELKYVRTTVFNTLILSNIFLTFTNRSFTESIVKTLSYKNALAPWVIFISLGFLITINTVSFLRDIFQLSLLTMFHYFICLIVSLFSVCWFELIKGWRRGLRVAD
jgi:P-type Ca2+ transporter type 2C